MINEKIKITRDTLIALMGDCYREGFCNPQITGTYNSRHKAIEYLKSYEDIKGCIDSEENLPDNLSGASLDYLEKEYKRAVRFSRHGYSDVFSRFIMEIYTHLLSDHDKRTLASRGIADDWAVTDKSITNVT